MIRLQGARRSNVSEMFLLAAPGGGQDPPEDPLDPAPPGFGDLWLAVVGVLTVVALGIGCGMYATLRDTGGSAVPEAPSPDTLRLLNLSDASRVTWASLHDVGVTSLPRLVTSSSGVMVMARVTSEVTFDNLTEPVVVVENSSVPLRDVLKVLERCPGWLDPACTVGAGLRLELTPAPSSLPAARSALSLLHHYTATRALRMPVWVHADVIGGPGWTSPYRRVSELAEVIQTVLPQATLSLGYLHGCWNSSAYIPSDIEALWTVLRPRTMPVSLWVCLDALGRAWPSLQWLLSRAPGRFSLSVYRPTYLPHPPPEGRPLLDLLLVRGDLCRRRLYLPLPPDLLTRLTALERTAGTPVNAFPVPGNDAAFIRWSRDSNTRQALLDAMAGNVMLQGDVSAVVNGTLWMGRSPGDARDVTLPQWLGTARNADLGVKIHIRSDAVVEPTLRFLSRAARSGRFGRPLWVQANVYEGQGARDALLARRAFRDAVTSHVPHEVTVCLGWAVGSNPGPYTRDMVARMSEYARPFTNQVVLAVRAGAARASWPVLMMSLQSSRKFKLLVWAEDNEEVDIRDLVYIHRKSEIHRVYYSLPGTLHRTFLQAVRDGPL